MSFWINFFKVAAVVFVVIVLFHVAAAIFAILTYALAIAAIVWVAWEIYKYIKKEDNDDEPT